MKIAYELIPYERNQDVVQVSEDIDAKPEALIASVLDGWNDETKIPGNQPGREVALYAQARFPEIFLGLEDKDVNKRAQAAAAATDSEVLERFHPWASSTGIFLFKLEQQLALIAVGSIVVYASEGEVWQKPTELKDHGLDLKRHPVDVSRFFGLGALKSDPFYSAMPDVATRPLDTSIFIATDGLESVMSDDELKKQLANVRQNEGASFVQTMAELIKQRRDQQKDDCSILLYTSKQHSAYN